MARKTKTRAVIPTKGKMVHESEAHSFYYLNDIAKRGHAKNRFRHGVKNAYGRYRASAAKFRADGITYGVRFIRSFSMFLVCLVLLSAVTNSSYNSYKVAVRSVYSITNTVSDITETALDYSMKLINFVGNLVDDGDIDVDIEDEKDRQYYTANVKVGKSKVNFIVYQVRTVSFSSGGTTSWKIVSAPEKYSDWVGKNIKMFLFWYSLPNGNVIFITSVDLTKTDYKENNT